MLRYIAFTAAAMALPTAAQANADAAAGMRISLVVPEICELETRTLMVDEDDGVTTLNIFEMCNSGRHFRIMASHRVLSEGESVQIDYDGDARALASSGISEVAVRRGPIAATVPVRVRTEGLRQGVAISLGLAAI